MTQESGLSERGLPLVEWGFLAAVVLEPWGPVLRYAALAVCLSGLLTAFSQNRKGLFRCPFDAWAARDLGFVLLWSLVVQLVAWPAPAVFFRGLSLPVEFAFSLFLAAAVLSRKKMAGRFETAWFASMTLVVLWTLWRFFVESRHSGPFGNINKLGIYVAVVLPFVLARVFEPRSALPDRLFSWALFIGCFGALAVSLTSSAWITAAFETVVVAALLRPPKARILAAFGVLCLFGAAAAGFLYLKDSPFLDYAGEELRQLSLVDDPFWFTNKRWFIWKETFRLASMKPFFGWGWSTFQDVYRSLGKPVPYLGQPAHPHNLYLALLFRGGVPLLVSVMFLFLAAARKAFKKAVTPAGGRNPFFVAVFTAIAGQLLFGVGHDIFELRGDMAFLFWALLGAALGGQGIQSPSCIESGDPPPKGAGCKVPLLPHEGI
ncbi:MAG: O-antigen ligase family protein [Thermovirgaceae bacterium]